MRHCGCPAAVRRMTSAKVARSLRRTAELLASVGECAVLPVEVDGAHDVEEAQARGVGLEVVRAISRTTQGLRVAHDQEVATDGRAEVARLFERQIERACVANAARCYARSTRSMYSPWW